ncbi:biotin--[acetyl-CoA-carboxylase] ligase [Anaerobacillus alkaliphilus]|uniref:Bifunctional ligase/repressor BirA n=1 Tax=Anaerobacillus alkaliphilus TaxID=1548597 RepID=A0A4Q0VW91_9BACI|nr:biotin--[acetyl-CoA-carboxylase] ligase [Anaerobacillus alkaliphilus]RXJ03977.1 biotin--[acetyl-CoA-carboxylase] ligase [Anaerobacillus alkaliphilus]
MRSELLQMLLDHQGNFVSGEAISQHLGCSRTAVWKHIEELRKAGYKLEAAPRKGYRIIHQPNLLTENEIKAGLKTNYIGKHVVYEKSVSSTQEIAHRLAREKVAEGTIVVADEQVGGKGRLGRAWFSPIGTGIWMSMILKPKIPPQRAPQLTLLAAVAVIRGIHAATGLHCDIKWPNDILLKGKKLVGILTEMQADPDQIHSVIIGIGINVNQKNFPDEIKEIATSLSLEKGEDVNRALVMQSIMAEFEQLYELFLKDGFLPIKQMWEAHATTIGRRITARTVSGAIEGFAKGITEDGVLLLEDDFGTIHKIYSADIDF